jgi:hypothetical protein
MPEKARLGKAGRARSCPQSSGCFCRNQAHREAKPLVIQDDEPLGRPRGRGNLRAKDSILGLKRGHSCTRVEAATAPGDVVLPTGR